MPRQPTTHSPADSPCSCTDHPPPSSAPALVARPAGEQFSDPQTGVVWAAISSMEEAAKHDLLTRLREHLAVSDERGGPQGVRVARAIAALREAHDEHLSQGGSGPLGVNTYRRLRDTNPERNWPPDGSVRRWLGQGSWNDALRTAHLEAVSGGDTTPLARGSDFTAEEATAAVNACAEELGHVPSLGEYTAWARRPEVRQGQSRVPRSQCVFDRLFGGWLQTLIAARLVKDSRDGVPSVGRLVMRPAAYRFQPAQMSAALRACKEELGLDRSPRSTEYGLWRTRLMADQTGDSRILPSYVTLMRHYGTWDSALRSAGLRPFNGPGGKLESPARHREPKPRYSDQQLCEFLCAAYAAKGDPFTVRAYRDWREQELSRLRTAQRWIRPRIPSYECYAQRFGSWEQAICRAAIHREEGAREQPSSDPTGNEQSTGQSDSETRR